MLYRYFKKILCLLSTAPFYQMYIQLGTGEYVPSKIRRNPIFFPYFKDAIGAIDGSHIPAAPPALLHRQYRNRKGYLSQNALFNLKFTYTLLGWEESAMDACIYDDAIVSNGLRILDRKYLLANAGYLPTTTSTPCSLPRYLLPPCRMGLREYMVHIRILY